VRRYNSSTSADPTSRRSRSPCGAGASPQRRDRQASAEWSASSALCFQLCASASVDHVAEVLAVNGEPEFDTVHSGLSKPTVMVDAVLTAQDRPGPRTSPLWLTSGVTDCGQCWSGQVIRVRRLRRGVVGSVRGRVYRPVSSRPPPGGWCTLGPNNTNYHDWLGCAAR